MEILDAGNEIWSCCCELCIGQINCRSLDCTELRRDHFERTIYLNEDSLKRHDLGGLSTIEVLCELRDPRL
jgi:hypothetical protein